VKLSDEKIELDNVDPHLGQTVVKALSLEPCINSANLVTNVNLLRCQLKVSD
jgi:hypothetical protein